MDGNPGKPGSGTLRHLCAAAHGSLLTSVDGSSLSASQLRPGGEGLGRSPGWGPEGGDITLQVQSSLAHLCPPWQKTEGGEGVQAIFLK